MSILEEIKRDYQAIFKRDPAVKGMFDVLFNYSTFYAIVSYRIIHRLWKIKIPLIPRFLSQFVRFTSGIEIHPSAKIGAGFFIDHGMGVVIGETAEIGEECLMYQGVTLGGTGKEKGKRHPTIGNHVVIGAGAKVLGAIEIGDYVKIGANSVVLDSVPAHSIVVGVPGRIIKKKIIRVLTQGVIEELDHLHMPDPVEERFKEVETHIHNLERKIDKLMGRGEEVKLFNTLTGKKEDFIPINDKDVGIYACGVTVYDLCHVGHARSAIVFDIIRRYLIYRGYNVKFIRNFTDIDDKIINRAKEKGIPWDEVAKNYTKEYYYDMDMLGVERANVEPKATEHIEEMIEIISGLTEKGYAYVVDGDVFFNVERFEDYGKLSKKNIDDLEAGARIEINTRKKNPLDFALWKASKEGEPAWDSPWGAGRPGWHIECSAMSFKHLGESFDIHGGGADLIFPHHENEIAQSESYTGEPFVRYWVHNGFITIDKEKMSKSLGNFFTIREILKMFDPEVLRVFLLSTHYRSPIEFSDDQLRHTESSIDRYYSTITRIDSFLKEEKQEVKKPDEEERLQKIIDSFGERFLEAMDDDFNTALAIGNIFEMVREINRYLDSKPSGQSSKDLISMAMNRIEETGRVLNIFQKSPREWNISLMKTRKIPIIENEIEDLIVKRIEARKQKDYKKADSIRSDLDEKGIILEDKRDKTSWKVKV